jgi:hypothetical protein
MSKITITEALQEIKTIGKRLEKKRNSITPYLVRDTRNRDPLAKDGGSEKFITSERQAIASLENNIIKIRVAIQQSNLTSLLTIGNTIRSVAEWLTWRKEVSLNQVSFLRGMATGLNSVRNEVQKKGGRTIQGAAVQVNEGFDPQGPPEVVVNVDEQALLAEQEELETILGTLDGKLSLFNASTIVEVPQH